MKLQKEMHMAKTLVSVIPGALTRLLQERNLTQADLKEKSRVDVKTIRRIASGGPVKDTTLKAVADALKIPTSYLTEGDVTSAEIIPFNRSKSEPTHDLDNDTIRVAEDAQEFPLKRATAAALATSLQGAKKICWRLQIQSLPPDTITLLKQLEAAIEAWRVEANSTERANSLSHQLELVETSNKVQRLLDELRDSGVGVFSGTYLFWSKEEVDEYYEVHSLSFMSEPHVLIVLHSSTSTLLRLPYRSLALKTGEPPPSSFEDYEGVRVRVDGWIVWDRKPRGRQHEVDLDPDGVPF